MKYSYPYRAIKRNASPELDLSKAVINCAEGVRSRRSWEPKGGKWKKSNSLSPYNIKNVTSSDTIVQEIANEYLLANIDGGIKIPRLPYSDLFTFPEVAREINAPAQRQNPIQMVFYKEIINEATAQLSAKLKDLLEITPEIKAKFEMELKSQIENQVNTNVSIDHYTVLVETGLPVNTDLIVSWESKIGKTISDFLDDVEPGLITGISGFILRGFQGETVTISESAFTLAAKASIDEVKIEQIGLEISEIAASWSRTVNTELDFKIKQLSKSNSFYPLWVQYADNDDLSVS